jgi:hypothetical protein
MGKIHFLFYVLIIPILGKEKRPLDLPSLCEQADRYELPKPPGNSKLVLFHTGSVTGQNGSWSPIYDAAFLLKKNGDGTDSVMTGFAKIQTDVDDNEYPLILPFDGTVKKALPNEYVFRCDTMNCFATAIQCARRGSIETAGTLAGQYLRQRLKGGFKTMENGRLYDKNLSLLVARITFEYYYQYVLEENADLERALKFMETLQREFPELFSKNPENFFTHYRTLFVQDLRLTVESPEPVKGSIEDKLFRISKVDRYHEEERYQKLEKQIHLKGVAVIPELVRLSTSRKLTTVVIHGLNNSPDSRGRLARIATGILSDMIGAHDTRTFRPYIDPTRKEWLNKVDLSDEKQFFIDALSETTGKGSHNDEIPLRILLHRQPKAAIELVDKVVYSQLSDFVSAVMESKLDDEGKIQTLLKAFIRTKGLHLKSLRYHLPRLNSTTVKKRLLSEITSLPNDVKGPYCKAKETKLSLLVMQFDDLALWRNYQAKVKTLSIGLRMELLTHLNHPESGGKNQKLRLAFLASFLSDTEVRTIKQNDKHWEGPHAGFTYDNLSVQNFAAEKIASILELPGDPADHWTEKQWKPFRQKVQTALSKLTLPDLS